MQCGQKTKMFQIKKFLPRKVTSKQQIGTEDWTSKILEEIYKKCFGPLALTPPTNLGGTMILQGGRGEELARRSKLPLPSYKGKSNLDTHLIQEFQQCIHGKPRGVQPVQTPINSSNPKKRKPQSGIPDFHPDILQHGTK